MILSRWTRVLFLVLLSLCIAGPAHGQAFQTVVVFGDSLSDTGNVAHLTQSAYGIAARIPGTAGNYTDGRFTNGTDTVPPARNYNGVWIEQLASTFTTKPVIKDSLDGGTNYAYGFATTGSGTSKFTFGPGNLLSVNINNMGQQVSDYLATTPAINSQTLFIVWGGANDLLNATSTAAITTAATQEVALIQRLIAAGATNFMVPSLPPLGLIPRLNSSTNTSVPATQGAALFNQALAAGLATLPGANPGKTLHLYSLDVFTLFNFIVGPPIGGGLANVTASSQGNISVNPDTYLFWDDLHPTTFGHHLVELAASTLLNPVITTTILSASAPNGNLNSAITLTATVSGGTGALAPNGFVTFMDGSTMLGTSVAVTMASTTSSSATYTTSALGAGVHSLTAVFTGANGFGNSTSSPVMQTVTAPALTPSLSPASLTISRGSSGTSTVTLSPVGGYAGTVTLACGILPAHVTCSFSNASFTFTASSTAQTSTLTISTKDMTSAMLRPLHLGSGMALAGLPCLGLLALFRRRNGMRGAGLVCLAMLLSGSLVALSGCGSSSSNNIAPAGSYTVPVVVTAGGSATTLNVAVTVQ